MKERPWHVLGAWGSRARELASRRGGPRLVVALLLVAGGPAAAEARQQARGTPAARSRPLAPPAGHGSPVTPAPPADDDAWRRVLVQPPSAAAWEAARAREQQLRTWQTPAGTASPYRWRPGGVDGRVPQIADGDIADLLAFAASLLGRPYRYGSDTGAFDCSGFVRHVFGEFGVELPHSSRAQFALGDAVGRDELRPGDLVFFRSGRGRAVNHVGIYLGDDRFLHAARHKGRVMISSLSEAYYERTFAGARRLDR